MIATIKPLFTFSNSILVLFLLAYFLIATFGSGLSSEDSFSGSYSSIFYRGFFVSFKFLALSSILTGSTCEACCLFKEDTSLLCSFWTSSRTVLYKLTVYLLF